MSLWDKQCDQGSHMSCYGLRFNTQLLQNQAGLSAFDMDMKAEPVPPLAGRYGGFLLC